MGVRRWLRRRFAGVEDPARDAAGHSDRRHFVYYTIENAPFQKWVVFVAAVGFLTDAYDIFALNVVSLIVPWVYFSPDGNPGVQIQAAMLCSTLAGAFFGQLIFGLLGDLYGRRKMYGLELLILIVGSIGTAMASAGQNGSMNFLGWFVFWRIFMGIGIGADYPISAVITSEFAPRKHRARMLAFVFWMQAIGQILVYAIALIVIRAQYAWLSQCVPVDSQGGVAALNGSCLQNLDRTWRWVVGLGAVPAAIAIFFRLTIPQSPRFLMDVVDEVDRAVNDTADYYGPAEVPLEMQQNQTAPLTFATSETVDRSPRDSGTGPISSNKQQSETSPGTCVNQPSRSGSVVSSVASIVLPNAARASVCQSEGQRQQSWWAEFQDYFFRQGNWRLLAGTAGAWFLLDIPFYGIELSSASIINRVWDSSTGQPPGDNGKDLYTILMDTIWHNLVITGIGALVGGAAFIKLIKYVTPKTMQVWGFVVLTALLLVTGIVLLASKTGSSAFIVLYVLVQLNFSLGPNTTTYLIPAELFPTRFRCTCHGLSAAAGRLGGITAQLIVTLSPFAQSLIGPPTSKVSAELQSSNIQTVGRLFAVLCIFPALGAALSWFLTPETRDKHGNARSLETLAKGNAHLKKLNREADPEDIDS